MHTWVYKRKKSTFFTALNVGKLRFAACLLHNINIAVVSEYLCHLKPQYPIPFPEMCIGQQIYLLTTQGQ